MDIFNFTDNSLWLNLLLFGAGAAVIWYAGSKLERYADTIASRYNLGKAFAGLLLLAGATSLPEIATTVTASMNNNGALAVNNLMGGVAMQIAVLAVADWTLAKGRLTFFTPKFSLLIQGVALIMLLSLCIAGIVAGELISFLSVGGWTILLMLLYLFLLYQIYLLRGNPRWQAVDISTETDDNQNQLDLEQPQSSNEEPVEMIQQPEKQETELEPQSPDSKKQIQNGHITRKALLMFGVFCLVVLGAGWSVAEVADVLTEQMQLSASFVGAVFVAAATSLPELSTTTAAVRRGNYITAISNIFGSNLMLIALMFVADIFYRNGSILSTGGNQTIFTAALGLVLTSIYLWGLLERRNKTVWRIGIDSAIIIFVYLGGIAVLYNIG